VASSDATIIRVVSSGTATPDLTACDREPIHIPGSIQPHGLLLIADAGSRRVVGVAGDLEGRLTLRWRDAMLDDLLGVDVAALLAVDDDALDNVAVFGVDGLVERFDATLRTAGAYLLVELEPQDSNVASATEMLGRLDAIATAFERAPDLQALCDRAAIAFRTLTGFDRVMVYRFLDDNAGMVLAEARDPGLASFLNHHFPASDIPKQARALYVRNRVRVIPEVTYTPAPIRGAAGIDAIDLSDVALRSVSPIHLQYMRNMGVGASASVSIVKDGLLWGLIACHHNTPRQLSYATRAAARALAGSLARQIRAKEEAEAYRERLRLRASEDAIVARYDLDAPLGRFVEDMGHELARLLSADGFAMLRGQELVASGICPPEAALRGIAREVAPLAIAEPFASSALATRVPAAADHADTASGLIAAALGGEDAALLMWFRAEEPEIVNWAGNPHKAVAHDPNAVLTPRTSFEAWREEVQGRARAWTIEEIASVSRLRRALFERRQQRRLRNLNQELAATVADRETLLIQKDHLLREVNHRVQNSLQLVQAFLSLQARADPAIADRLEEASRRLSAVALVHRRLYQGDQVETVDLARYLEDLLADTREAMGPEWAAAMVLDLAPILISADRAVQVGLIVTELVINANKYAYGGRPGPLAISLERYRNQFRLIVADKGKGADLPTQRTGFGTRMMNAMIQGLGGTFEQSDNQPGLRVIVSAPITAD
jgi:light-regulated signal transduction histidine kinase (bacteriophytochrome)